MRKYLIIIATVIASLSAFSAFEDGEKVLVEGVVPPHTLGAYRPFLLPGVIVEADGCVEYRLGHGLKIWYPSSLSAHKLAALKKFMASPMKPIDTSFVGYIGDSKGKSILDNLGVQYKLYDERNYWLVGSCEVVAIGGGIDKILKQKKQVDALLKAVRGAGYVIVLPGADLKILPQYALQFAPAKVDSKKPSLPNLPLFLGAKQDYFDFLKNSPGAEFPATSGGPAWIASSSPAYFTHLKYRGNSIIFMNVAPKDAPAAARDSLTRFWCTVLANLNVYTGKRK